MERINDRYRRFAPAAFMLFLIFSGASQTGAEIINTARTPGEIGKESTILDKNNPRIRAVMNVQDRHRERLMAIPGVVGTATGLGPDGQPAIKVFTMQEGMPGIPESIEGIPVTAVTTGMIVALTDPTIRFDRPVPTGVSTGHPNITAGTIGTRVKDASLNVYALSNNHVFADSNDAVLGDSILQPGPYDGGVDPIDKIGELFAFQPIDFSGGDNTIDAAIAVTTAGLVGNATPLDDGYGAPGFNPATASIGQWVRKYGRTTKLTYGQVSELNVTVNVCYEPMIFFCLKQARFVNQIAVTPGTFSAGGDSGSLIVTDDGFKKPVALLFAGSSTRVLANPIDLVLNRFSVSVDGEEPTPLTDIAVRSFSVRDVVYQGDTVPADVVVRNVGTADIGTDITVSLTNTPPSGGNTGVISDSPQILTGGLTTSASGNLTFHWNTTGAALGAHTLTVRQEFVDDNAGNDSAGAVVTVIEPTAHVGDLDGSRFSYHPNKWGATVYIVVHDGGHRPVESATVIGSWSGGYTLTSSCVTNSYGQCSMTTGERINKQAGSVTFTVDSVSHGRLSYDMFDNHDPDGDSNGTTVTIYKP